MSLSDNTDNNITITNDPSNTIESQMTFDSTNKSNEFYSAGQTESHQNIHNKEKLHQCSACDKCFHITTSLEETLSYSYW